MYMNPPSKTRVKSETECVHRSIEGDPNDPAQQLFWGQASAEMDISEEWFSFGERFKSTADTKPLENIRGGGARSSLDPPPADDHTLGGPSDDTMTRLQECFDATTRLLMRTKELTYALMQMVDPSPTVSQASEQGLAYIKALSTAIEDVEKLLMKPRSMITDLMFGLVMHASAQLVA